MNNILNTGGGLKAYDRQIEYLATALPDGPEKYEPQLSDTTRCLGELIKQRRF